MPRAEARMSGDLVGLHRDHVAEDSASGVAGPDEVRAQVFATNTGRALDGDAVLSRRSPLAFPAGHRLGELPADPSQRRRAARPFNCRGECVHVRK